jgi:hypothetical protein
MIDPGGRSADLSSGMVTPSMPSRSVTEFSPASGSDASGGSLLTCVMTDRVPVVVLYAYASEPAALNKAAALPPAPGTEDLALGPSLAVIGRLKADRVPECSMEVDALS